MTTMANTLNAPTTIPTFLMSFEEEMKQQSSVEQTKNIELQPINNSSNETLECYIDKSNLKLLDNIPIDSLTPLKLAQIKTEMSILKNKKSDEVSKQFKEDADKINTLIETQRNIFNDIQLNKFKKDIAERMLCDTTSNDMIHTILQMYPYEQSFRNGFVELQKYLLIFLNKHNQQASEMLNLTSKQLEAWYYRDAQKYCKCELIDIFVALTDFLKNIGWLSIILPDGQNSNIFIINPQPKNQIVVDMNIEYGAYDEILSILKKKEKEFASYDLTITYTQTSYWSFLNRFKGKITVVIDRKDKK